MIPFELDHFALYVSDRAGAVAALERAGLTLGRDGIQRGTGAGHSIYFFDNTYLEVVWPEPGRPVFADGHAMRIAERIADPGVWCPLGLSFRPRVRPDDLNIELPIETWGYQAAFLPKDAVPIPIATSSEIPAEPLVFVSLVSGRPDRNTWPTTLQSDRRFAEVVSARVTVSAQDISSALQALPALLPVEVLLGDASLLSLVFNVGPSAREIDLRPDLPLTLWV